MGDTDKSSKGKKQTEQVLQYMREHGSITQAEAYYHLSIFRLGARIWDLKRAGHKIKSVLEDGFNRNMEKTRYARYFLVEEGETE